MYTVYSLNQEYGKLVENYTIYNNERFSILYKVYIVYYILYIVECTLYSLQCTMFTVHCTVYNVYYTVYSYYSESGAILWNICVLTIHLRWVRTSPLPRGQTTTDHWPLTTDGWPLVWCWVDLPDDQLFTGNLTLVGLHNNSYACMCVRMRACVVMRVRVCACACLWTCVYGYARVRVCVCSYAEIPMDAMICVCYLKEWTF